MTHRSIFEECRKTNNWHKCEGLINELINLTDSEDAEHEKAQREKAEKIAEKMNNQEKAAANFGKKV